MKRIVCLSLASLLAACAVPQPYEPPAPQTPSERDEGVQTQPGSPPSTVEPSQPLPEPVSREPVLSPASRALVTQAQTQLKSKNYPVAAASIERALRIEPGNPLLWIELAKVRQAEGAYVQAENIARKAVSMSVQAPKAQSQAWLLVAQSLKAQGKNVEAQQAQGKADALRHR